MSRRAATLRGAAKLGAVAVRQTVRSRVRIGTHLRDGHRLVAKMVEGSSTATAARRSHVKVLRLTCFPVIHPVHPAGPRCSTDIRSTGWRLPRLAAALGRARPLRQHRPGRTVRFARPLRRLLKRIRRRRGLDQSPARAVQQVK